MPVTNATKEKATDAPDVKKADVADAPEKQDKPEVAEDENSEAQYYVWLSNGSVKRVAASDVQSISAPYGHWQSGNKVYQIVAVYAVEDTVKDAK